MTNTRQHTLPGTTYRDLRYLTPHQSLQEDFEAVYTHNEIIVGWPKGEADIYHQTAEKRFIGIIGGQLGDEGKGRIVDNQISSLLKDKKIKHVYVVRFNGGNNAGHTIEQNGVKLALHQVPSGVFYQRATGIMDTGMAINIEDLETEVTYIETAVGSLAGRLKLSERASLNTDLERALEWFNNQKRAKSRGGTSRGISPTYARRLDRTGLIVRDLLAADWEEKLGQQYADIDRLFNAYDIRLAEVVVPDFRQTVASKRGETRSVGTKSQFLKRLLAARSWAKKRDMVTDTILLHEQAVMDPAIGVVFISAMARIILVAIMPHWFLSLQQLSLQPV